MSAHRVPSCLTSDKWSSHQRVAPDPGLTSECLWGITVDQHPPLVRVIRLLAGGVLGLNHAVPLRSV